MRKFARKWRPSRRSAEVGALSTRTGARWSGTVDVGWRVADGGVPTRVGMRARVT
jgi:hypothetical protein